MSARTAFRWALCVATLVHVALLGVVYSANGGTFAAVTRMEPLPPPPALVQAALPLVERGSFIVEPGAAAMDVLGGGTWLRGPLGAIDVPRPAGEWLALLPATVVNVLLTAGVLVGIAWGGPTLVARAWRRRRAAAA